MKILVLSLMLLLAVLLALALLSVDGSHWGQVAVAFGNRQINMGLPSFFAFLVALLVALRLLEALWKLPKHWAVWWQQLGLRKKEKTLLTGLSLFAQGEWHKAHEHFADAGTSRRHLGLSRLLSLLALVNGRSFTQAKRILRGVAAANVPDLDRIAEIKHAEIALHSGHYKQAFGDLKQLLVIHPHNKHVASLLLQAYLKQDQAMPPTLRQQLLSMAGNKQALAMSTAAEQRLLSEQLREMMELGNKKVLNKVWKEIHRPMQEQLAGVYAECLGQLGLHEQAEGFMQHAISMGWGHSCLDYYAKMNGGHIDQRIAHIEKCLHGKPHTAELLLCLGRLYHRRGEQEKACRCLSLWLELTAPSAEHQAT